MSCPDPRRGLSPFSFLVNPELYAKPNLRVGLAGTALFAAILGRLLWEKHRVESERKKAVEQAGVARLERRLGEGA